jgi:glucose-6-phosphate isomerase
MAFPLKFTYENCLDTAVGKDGISRADLSATQAAEAVRAFRARVESGAIGFPHLPDDRQTASAIAEFADDIRDEIDHVCIVGIGGSALSASALDIAMRGPHPVQTAAGKPNGRSRAARPQLVVLDNVDPGFIAAALERMNPKRTLVVVIAKSGSTAESLATFLIVREWLVGALGKRNRERIVAITDPQKGDLLQIAKAESYPLFFVPPAVGGRFTVLSPVGLLPAALLGLDIAKLLRGARDANAACWSEDIEKNPALLAAALHHALDTRRGKKIEVVYAYSSFLWGAAFWYRQLWAESLGKRVNRKGEVVECGQTPVAALGVTDQHSQSQLYMEGPRDKMITFWEVERTRAELKIPRDFAKYDSCGYLGGKTLGQLFRYERMATEAALTEAGRPNCRWTLPRVDEYTIGALFETLEFQTAFAGELYGVDAFDQPGVELGKKMTYGLMGRKGYEQFAKRVKVR